VLGLLRESVFAALLGAGYYADAFRIAFRIPNLLRDLFAEGALSAAFVPTYARTLRRDGRATAHRLACRLLTLLAVVFGLLVLAGILGAGWIVPRFVPGFGLEPGKVELTVLLTRIMMPFLPLVSFAAVAMGMLNAEERFGLPALSPAMFNVVTILWGVALWAAGLPLFWVAVGWALGTLVGGVAQAAIQWPGLHQQAFRFRADWAPSDPGLREIGSLMTPAVVGLAAVQINILVNSHFASRESGAVTALDCAFRILYLPIGIFGVAVGTIATSGFARNAAASDMDGVRSTLRAALSMLAFLTIPSTVGLMVLREPIVRLIYEHGRFDAEGTRMTAAALGYYAIGLVAYTTVKVLAPAFYALGSPVVPLLASASAVATNLALNLTLHQRFGFRAVALGTAVGSVANALVLAVGLERRIGGVLEARLLWTVGRTGLAALVMGGGAFGAERFLSSNLGQEGPMARLAVGLVPVLIGALIFFALAFLFRLDEMKQLRVTIGRRFRRPKE
jgi:putative peptidoglycan lipid II flippase